jgi:hypothetical protein
MGYSCGYGVHPCSERVTRDDDDEEEEEQMMDPGEEVTRDTHVHRRACATRLGTVQLTHDHSLTRCVRPLTASSVNTAFDLPVVRLPPPSRRCESTDGLA